MSRDTKPRMGRPPSDNPKSERAQICMTSADAAVIKQAAGDAGEPLQVYLVKAGLARAKHRITIDDAIFDAFSSALASPAPPTKALRALVGRRKRRAKTP